MHDYVFDTGRSKRVEGELRKWIMPYPSNGKTNFRIAQDVFCHIVDDQFTKPILHEIM